MAAAIFFFLHLFHAVAFPVIAYLLGKEGHLRGSRLSLIVGFTVAAVLANIIVGLLLMELGSGLSLIARRELPYDYFSSNFKILLFVQPIFALYMYLALSQILKFRRKPRS